MQTFSPLANPSGLTDTPGFKCSGVHCDVRGKKDGRLDLALIHSDLPCTAAGVFTKNRFFAPPVQYCREVLNGTKPVHGIVANSGNANAATGAQGLADAVKMGDVSTEVTSKNNGAYFVCSTGRIGVHLPMASIEKGIRFAAQFLSDKSEEGLNAAKAILTSDTREKLATARFTVGGKEVTISGIAKGAGMIQPNMATMLAFIATDAVVEKSLLQALLSEAVDSSFNAITVDGDMSTNDTVLLLANGASGVAISEADSASLNSFKAALQYVCDTLAEKIVGDGEKISKVVEVIVSGARTRAEAEDVARRIGNSLLVKSSWCGEDPNWGRLIDAAGYANATFSQENVSVWYQPFGNTDTEPKLPAYIKGQLFHEKKPLWKALVSQPKFGIHLDLDEGTASYRLLATDLTEAYVTFNKSE